MATAVAIARILDVLSKLWPFRVVRCYLLASPTAWRTPRMLSTASSHCFAAVENLIAVFRTTSRFVYCCTRSTRPMEAVVGLAGPCVCECVSVCVFIFSGFQRLWLLVFSLDSFLRRCQISFSFTRSTLAHEIVYLFIRATTVLLHIDLLLLRRLRRNQKRWNFVETRRFFLQQLAVVPRKCFIFTVVAPTNCCCCCNRFGGRHLFSSACTQQVDGRDQSAQWTATFFFFPVAFLP